MILHEVRVHPSKAKLAREEQLAWKIAEVAADRVAVERDVATMIINRMIDNASVAIAAINRRPVVSARDMALGHPRKGGATVFGASSKIGVSPEWAAWANGTAVRELDMHDTFLAADYSHPGDNIPPILAVAQVMGRSGRDLVRAIATGYEIHIDLVRAICLHAHKIDHIAHLCPAQAAGIGTLLRLPAATIYQAVQQAVHVSFTTRQSRKGEISSLEGLRARPCRQARDRGGGPRNARRGRAEPDLRRRGQRHRLDARRPRRAVPGAAPRAGRGQARHPGELHQGALGGIPEPGADRPRLPHARADQRPLQGRAHRAPHEPPHALRDRHRRQRSAEDGPEGEPRDARPFDHVHLRRGPRGRAAGTTSTATRRNGPAAPSTVALWHKIETREDPEWTRRYHSTDPDELAFGGRIEVFMQDGTRLEDELAVANAHPNGARPFGREDYIRKFRTLTEGIVATREANRFLEAVQDLPSLKAEELHLLNVALPAGTARRRQARHFLRRGT